MSDYQTKNNFKPMEMDIINMDRFISKYKLKEVKSERILSYGNTLNPDGLFSYDIFGRPGTTERMNNTAYINLNCFVMEPYVFLTLIRMSSKFLKLATGKLYYNINKDNKLEESTEENENTGMSFIYKNFKLIKDELIKETGTEQRKMMIEFLNNVNINEIFVNKWIIIPAGLREINTMDLESKGIVNYEPINDYYLDLIKRAKSLKASSIFGILMPMIEYKIQESLNNIYNLLINTKVSKKGGIIQQASLARTITYAVGSVIANAKYSRNTYLDKDSTNIRFGYIGIPVGILTDMFYPFVFHRLKQIFSQEEGLRKAFYAKMMEKESNTVNTELVEDFIVKVIQDKDFLFEPFTYIGKDGKSYEFEIADGIRYTVIDFMKNEVIDPIISDKFVTGTRYPIDNRASQQFLKPICTTTDKVKTIELNSMKVELVQNKNYVGCITPNIHSYTPWGADVDGDTIATIGIFSVEANNAIKQKSWLRHKSLTTTNNSIATMSNELLFGLFNLTED